MIEQNQPEHSHQNTETGFQDVSKKKHKVNWTLRIGLYIGLLIFWIFALGFLENIEKPIKDDFMQQARQGADLQQTARNTNSLSYIK